MTDEELNAAIEVSPSPRRVTRELIERHIVNKSFVGPVETLTICILNMANGFKVTGESACVDPANYRQDIGEKIAYDNAFAKLWALEGYALATYTYETKDMEAGEFAPTNHVDRMLAEYAELVERADKLASFIYGSPTFATLAPDEREDMARQLSAMRAYRTALYNRLERTGAK